MGLRGKIIGLFFLFFGLMALLAMIFLKNNLADEFSVIEHKQAVTQMQQLTGNLNGELDRLSQLAYDWANWDDVYSYVNHPNKEFTERQFSATSLKDIEIKLLVILDPQDKPLFSESVNLVTGATENAASFDSILDNIKRRKAQAAGDPQKSCGMDLSSSGPMLLCWRPILRSDASGEPAGTLVIGRLLNSSLLEKIRRQSNVKFELTPLPLHEADVAQVEDKVIDADKVEFSATEPGVLNGILVNILGQPILKVRLQFPNDVSTRGEDLTWKVLRVLLLVTVLTGIALLFSVHYLIIRRLRKMDRDLSSIWRNGRWAGRLDAPPKKDELNDLSHSINRMLALIRKQMVMLEAIALTDPLTQIANRRAFDERIGIEMSLHKRNQAPLSLLTIDIDFFKRYNDLYGHPAGDEILKTLGNLLTHIACRPADLPARIGGEEFAILLPSTDLDGACHVAEILSSKLAEQKIVHADSSVSEFITLCIGVTSAGDEDVATFMQRAEKALYNAKQTGRNKTCVLPSA